MINRRAQVAGLMLLNKPGRWKSTKKLLSTDDERFTLIVKSSAGSHNPHHRFRDGEALTCRDGAPQQIRDFDSSSPNRLVVNREGLQKFTD
jgi:hypothetical protein